MVKSGFVVLSLLAFALLCLGGCTTDQPNFLKNPKFEKWSVEGPTDWKLEGEGAVARAEGSGAELKSKGTATPFIFQSFPIKRRYRGSTLTLAAWVRTNVPECAVIEFSDRQGHDFKSEPHPGDGAWRLLTLTVKAPDIAGNIEFRLRNYKAGSSFIKEASMSVGDEPLIAKRLDGRVTPRGGYKAAGYLLMFAFLAAIVAYFRRRMKVISYARVYEAFLVLLSLSGMMLMLNKPLNAEITADIAWSLLAISLIPGLVRRVGLSRAKDALLDFFKRPGAILITVSLLLLAATVNALHNGSVSEAGKTARGAYIFMVLGGASIIIRKAIRKLRPEESPSVRIYKIKPGAPETIGQEPEITG